MNQRSEKERVASRLRDYLERSAESLDETTVSRLRRARAAALAEATGSRRTIRPWALPLAASAALTVLVIGLSLGLSEGRPPYSAVEDLELLSAEDGLDLYEDLDFYQWLPDTPRTG